MIAVVKVAPRPAQRAAQAMRRAAADERARRALAAAHAGLSDPEIIAEVNRALIRQAGRSTAEVASEGRAAGVLCGALADISPAYAAPKRHAAAEALFKRRGEGA